MNGKRSPQNSPIPPGGTLYVLIMGVLLGLVPIFSAELRKQGWMIETAILIRLLLTIMGSAAVIIFLRLRRPENGHSFRLQPRHILNFLGYGVVSVAAVNFLYLKSLEYTTASIAVFSVFAAAPTTTLIVTWLRKKAQPVNKELGLIAVIISGCILVNHADGWSMKNWLGASLAGAGGVCYGLYSIFGEKICKEYSALPLLFWQFTFASIATTVFYCLFPAYHPVFGQLLQMLAAPTLAIWAPALGLGILTTLLPYLLYGLGLRHGLSERPTVASALTLMEPVSAVVLAWFLLGQKLVPYQIAGCMLVIAASICLSRVRISK